MTAKQEYELKTILRKSEIHTSTCTIDSGITTAIFNHQIEKGYLTLSVSSKMVKKAIKVFELFLRRMFEEGFTLMLNCKSHFHCPASAIVVDGEVIPVRLKEKREFKVEYHGSSRYGQYVPTGKLVFEIYGGIRWNATRTLMETEEKKWSDLFEQIIPYLHDAAVRKKKDRLEAEEWSRKWEEQERKRKEHEQMIKDRVSIVESIMHDVELYEKAETIRRYCDTAEQLTNSEEDKKRMAAARLIADWIDPTTDYVDDILSEKYRVEDFL